VLLVYCRNKVFYGAVVLKMCWKKNNILLYQILVFNSASSINAYVFLKKLSVEETGEIFTFCSVYP